MDVQGFFITTQYTIVNHFVMHITSVLSKYLDDQPRCGNTIMHMRVVLLTRHNQDFFFSFPVFFSHRDPILDEKNKYVYVSIREEKVVKVAAEFCTI